MEDLDVTLVQERVPGRDFQRFETLPDYYKMEIIDRVNRGMTDERLSFIIREAVYFMRSYRTMANGLKNYSIPAFSKKSRKIDTMLHEKKRLSCLDDSLGNLTMELHGKRYLVYHYNGDILDNIKLLKAVDQRNYRPFPMYGEITAIRLNNDIAYSIYISELIRNQIRDPYSEVRDDDPFYICKGKLHRYLMVIYGMETAKADDMIPFFTPLTIGDKGKTLYLKPEIEDVISMNAYKQA